LCAEDAVKTVLTIMKEKKAKGLLLNYSNSGDKSQDKSRVVGYGAIIFYK
jgi:AmmeMemoRadiSam system protein B